MNQEIKEELINNLDDVYSKIINNSEIKSINHPNAGKEIRKILSLIDELQNEIEDIN